MKEFHASSKRLLSIKNSAEYLGRGVYGVRELIWSGQIPIVRNGRKIFLDIQDLDRYINSKKSNYFLREADERPGNGKSEEGDGA
jgi:excisionase family DNA binding protein